LQDPGLCLIIALTITCTAFAFDAVVGDPPSRLHPVVWMGRLIEVLKKLNRGPPRRKRILGVLTAIIAIVTLTLPIFFAFKLLRDVSLIACAVLGGLALKFTFAFRSLSDYTRPIAEMLERGDVEGARKYLPFIVRRDPSKLNEELIASAAVESIAESTVDGIASPLFYYALFGIAGAYAFRVVNTLDSMVGYKTEELKDFGWFSARLDTLLNFLTSRLTALLIALAAWILGMNARRGLEVALRDHSKTESVNAGWPMSAMAGVLGVRLVKPGSYELGDPVNRLGPAYILQAIKVMRVTTLLFAIIICLPLLALRCALLSAWVV
jgi:adenosylcobinamide-phosphate synthase